MELSTQTHALPGDLPPPVSAERLFAVFYDDLHRLARCHVARRVRDLSMTATALLHEAYLDMASRHRVFEDRGRFLAYVSRVMRARIVDHFRRVHARKRGSAVALRPLPDDLAEPAGVSAARARVGQALDGLASADPLLADIVELHFYGGFTYREIATLRGLSERTVQRLWGRARVYLRDAIRAGSGGPASGRNSGGPVESQGRFPSFGS